MSRTRYTLAFDSHNMTPGPVGTANYQAIYRGEDGVMIAYGTTVPTAATANVYSEGCLFIHSDAASNDALYVNNGTYASCDFEKVIEAANAVTEIDSEHGSGTAAGAGPSPLIWDDAPVLGVMLDPTQGFCYFNDYLDEIDITTTDGYVITTVNSGAIAPVVTEDGGVLLVDSAGNNAEDDGINVQLTNCMFKPLAGRTIYFEARVKMNDTSASISQFYIGLAGVATALIAGGAIEDTVDKAGFYRQHDSTGDKLSIISAAGSVEEISADKATVADGTYVKLGMVISGVTSVAFYVNGVLVDTHIVSMPTAVMCLSYVAQTQGATKDAELSIDWVRILQSGTRS